MAGRSFLGGLALAGAGLASCVAPLSPPYHCGSDTDCAWGFLCDTFRGECVAPAEAQDAGLSCGPQGTWNAQTLVSNVGRLFGDGSTALALDSQGRAHITYHQIENGNDLGYIYWSGSSWVNAPVDTVGAVGDYSSLALDDDDQPHIAWYDASGGALRYVELCSGCGPAADLDDTADVGKHTSIALDLLGRPHVVYYDQTNYDLLHMRWNGSQWLQELPIATAGDSGESASLVIDAAGGLHVVYGAGDTVVYSRNLGSGWQHHPIDTFGSSNAHTSLALDAQGGAHIAYRFNFTSEAGVKYARWLNDALLGPEIVDGCTPCETTADVGKYVSIAVDSRGAPHIVFFAGGYTQDHGLKHAQRVDGAFCVQYVARGFNVGEYTSLAVDGADTLHVSYLANGTLTYATGSE